MIVIRVIDCYDDEIWIGIETIPLRLEITTRVGLNMCCN